MQSFKTAVLNMSVCALFGSLAELLSMRKNAVIMRTVTAALVIIMTVSPLLNADIKLPFGSADELKEGDYPGGAQQAAAILERKLYADIENILISAGLNEYEIYIDIAADDTANTVSLEKITVLTDKKNFDAFSDIKERLAELYTCPIAIGEKQNE